MLPRIQTIQRESKIGTEFSVVEDRCPFCGGPLAEARALCRCLRCAFTVCMGCETEDRELSAEMPLELP